jgi:ADP-ribose pyrophosphatase YjhB (NUDIX family)
MNPFLRAIHLARKLIYHIFGVETRGVRVIVCDKGKILLIKPTYRRQWALPGGGVYKNEHIEDAAIREAAEEGNVVIEAFAKDPLGTYINTKDWRRDHITVLIAKAWKDWGRKTNWEIRGNKFFDLDKLPVDISPAARRRIEEYQNHQKNLHNANW